MTTMEQIEATLARITERQEQGVLSLEAFKAQLAASQEAADRRAAAAEITMEELKRQTKELGRQIGGLGNKFGSFTEGLALPSVETLLFDHFNIDEFHKRWKKRIGDKRIEIDGLGLVNGARN
ncbi:MAG: DUF3782 domain-containing protein, partial [Candidatus Kapaibacteriota bacterium]